jgi:hypothetical protein
MQVFFLFVVRVQQMNVKICFKLWSGLGDGMVELQMHKLLKTVYLSEVVSHVCVFKWFKRFREGCDSFENESSHCQL